MWDVHLGQINVANHRIVTNSKDVAPIQSASYRTGPKQKKLERKKIRKIRNVGVIELAVTKRTLPFVFVPNKDGRMRIRLNHRRLKAATE